MCKARFTECQIITVFKSVEAGRTANDVCREAGMSEAKYGGMEASTIKKMKDLEDENRRLKQMFSDLSLECRAPKDIFEKIFKPVMKRVPVNYLAAQFAMSIRQAFGTLSLSRTLYFYQPDTGRDEPEILTLTVLAERYPRCGFKKLLLLLCRQDSSWSHKRVHRIYCLQKLSFRRRGKLPPVRNPTPLATPGASNQSWSLIVYMMCWSVAGLFGPLIWWIILIVKR